MGAFVKFWGLKWGLYVENLGAKAGAIFKFWPGGYPKKLQWQLGKWTILCVGFLSVQQLQPLPHSNQSPCWALEIPE